MKTQTTKLYQNKPHLKLTLMMDMHKIATAIIEDQNDWDQITSHKDIKDIANALNSLRQDILKRKLARAQKFIEQTSSLISRPIPEEDKPPFYLRPSSNPNPSPTQPKEGDTQ
jgi:hypothetical protein